MISYQFFLHVLERNKMSKFDASFVDVYLYFFQLIIDKIFHFAISLMKTKSPDDHQFHALAKYGTNFWYQINCQLPDHWSFK